VVLGSSTAAGTGPSTKDSAWVWRYRTFLENINPANEVINLAVGGYVTYRLMPDNYQSPAGRPAPDTARNITKALSLNPDAIIVNLPSNDRRWPAADQLANFDSLYRMSTRAGVPMWICTTQPITSRGDYQREVRDSIVARYGSQALDFWTGIVAGSTNLVDSIYAADAVHLNDLGHRVLVNAVIAVDIPRAVFQAAPSPDLALVSLELPEQGACIDSMLTGRSVIINFGQSLGPGWTHQVVINRTPFPLTMQDSVPTCRLDTIDWSYPLRPPGNFSIRSELISPSDTFTSNDILEQRLSYRKLPLITGEDNIICRGEDATMRVSADADTVLWYESPLSTSPIGSSDSLFFPNIQQGQIRYAQAINGPLFYQDELTAATSKNRDWNGVMFDLIATDSLIVDSMAMFVSDSGRQEVTAYYGLGSHVPEAQNPAAWTLWGTDSVTFTGIDDAVHVDFGALPVSSSDTVGVYLHMSASNRRLQYQAESGYSSYNESVLELYAGTGVNYTHGVLYPNRHWRGKVFFHHGERLEGDCATARVPVEVLVT
jgi:lysophospholipase L1-like esterase